MGKERPTRRPHVHVEHDEVARQHVRDGQVAQAVQWVDLLRHTLQLPSSAMVHAVAAGAHVHDVQDQAET